MPEPTEEQIERRAYELGEQAGAVVDIRMPDAGTERIYRS